MMKRILSLLLAAVLIIGTLVGCSSKGTSNDTDNEKVSSENTENETGKSNKEVPKFRIGWNNELHTGNMHLAFEKPELFENNDVYLRPISNQHLELVKKGEVIAIVEVD